MIRQIVLSGIRPTAEDQHLGNYLGAIRYFAELSHKEDTECFFFVADLHALTTCGLTFEAEGIRRGRDAIVLNLLAAGVNPDSTIYTQSSIPELAELAWILGCLTRVGELETMHHWSEKRGKLSELGVEANAGLLTYPVLMAADILGPRADLVPVGEDQRQHVEFARELARTFNRVTNTQCFPVPNVQVRGEVTVRSTTHPEDKMGKSDPDGCVFLNDPPDVTKMKFARAASDPARVRLTDPGNPEICNVFTMHQQLSPGEDVLWAMKGCRDASIGCFECKMRVAGHVNKLLEPMRERRRELDAKGPSFITEILDAGNRRARARVAETVAAAKEIMGLSQAAKLT